MKSPASNKCAGGLLVALAMASIALMTACGSSNNIPTPNQGGFGDSNLTGTYVISISGTDVNSSSDVVPFAIAGTIAANGTGGITGGTLDINDPFNLGVISEAVSSTSSYQIAQDGRGTGTIVTSVGNFNIDFVMTTSSHGLISRFDETNTNIGTGSGTIDVQAATPSVAGSYAFSLAGTDSAVNPLATVGAFTVNGTSISGTEDFNDDGTSNNLTGLSLSGQLIAGASGAPSTATLTTSFGLLGFDVWVIDSTHLKFIETDATLNVLAGDAFTQQTSFTAGQAVFALSGFDSSLEPVVAGGYVTTDANGNLSAGLEDYNDAGTTVANTITGFGGSCNATAPFTGGRCELALNGFSNGNLNNFIFAAYPSSGGTQLLEIDGFGQLQGAAYPQSATAFTASGGYGLNLTGVNNVADGVDWFGVDNIAQFNAGAPDTSLTGALNMTGTLDENSLGAPLVTTSMKGVYVPDATTPVDGRGTISSTNAGTALGGFTLQYYVVDSSTVVFIDVDSVTAGQGFGQIAVGTFEAQNSAAGAVAQKAAAQSHVVIVHPAIRHGAFVRK